MTTRIPENLAQANDPLATEYELHATLPSGEPTKWIITATNVDVSNPHYLVFINGGTLVIAVPHDRVLDWSEVDGGMFIRMHDQATQVPIVGNGGIYAPGAR